MLRWDHTSCHTRQHVDALTLITQQLFLYYLPENSVAYARGLVHTHLFDFKYTHVKSFVAVSWTIMTLSWWQNLSTDRHINICESSQNHLCGGSRYSSCLHSHILPWWHTGRLTIWKQYQPCCHDCWQTKIWTLATDKRKRQVWIQPS